MMRSWILTAVTITFLAPRAFAGPDDGNVTAISVLPGPGSALVVIDVTGAVTVQDFVLDNPARLVVDVVGASLRAPGVSYDGANRGGIMNVRYSQFRPDVVRIVLELDALKAYELEYVDDAIRIALNTDRIFDAWSSGQLARSLEAMASAEATQPAVSEPLARLIQTQQPRITVSWDSAHIQDVIAGFAEFSGRSIIMGQDIDLLVWGEIRDQPWDVAFNEILEVNGLRAVEKENGVIVVRTPASEVAQDSLEPKTTVIMPVNNQSAASVERILGAMISERGGRVIADSSTNQLIITDARHRIAEDTMLLRQLDIPTAQVSIEAKLVFVDRTDIEQLGVQYDLGNQDQFFNQLVQRPDPSTSEPIDTDQDGVPDALVATEFFDKNTNIIDLGGNSLSAIGNAEAVIPQSALQLIFSTAIGNFNITSFVQALQQVELADLQAEPLITTRDNTAASILVGERTPIRVVDVGSQVQQQAQAPRATVDFVETGIRLDVTPHVTNASQVLLRIHAENSSFAEAAGADLGFIFRTQEADNQILVNDGETAVIGGLTVTQVTVSKSGIPFLVDLPLVGRLFGFTTRRENRRDLLILVTPHITDNPAGN